METKCNNYISRGVIRTINKFILIPTTILKCSMSILPSFIITSSFLIFVISVCLGPNPEASQGENPVTIENINKEPVPLNHQGNSLYSIYRRGMLTRHIGKNGRLDKQRVREFIQ